MRFGSAISTATVLDAACREAADQAVARLDGGRVDLCVVFVSSAFADKDRVAALLTEQLHPGHLIGCSGGGVVGGGVEVEGRPAVSVTVASLPDVAIHSTHLLEGDLPHGDAAQAAWIEQIGVQPADVSGFIVLPEPFTFSADRLLAGLDFAYPRAPVVGGLASGSQHPAGHALYHGKSVHHSGVVVLALGGAIQVHARVAQGCKPFGAVGRITKAEGNELFMVDQRPAGEFLQDQLQSLDGADRELATGAPVFLGIAMDPFAMDVPVPGDFLIRNVMAYDPDRGALTIGEHLPVGRSIQFHLRDRSTSADDLHQVLERGQRTLAAPRGALMFSCLGRGQYLYGEEGHDSRVFESVMGPVPLAGFFCNGEIGPVQGATHLHGYTSSFALFTEAGS